MTITSIAPEAPDYFSQAESSTLEHRKVDLLTFSPEQQQRLPDTKNDAEESEDISLQTVQHATEAMEAYMASSGVNLKFSVDDSTEIIQVEVREPDTNKLIRKIPADEMLELAASIEKMVGLFLNKTF
ncbi:MAG: flagellar protein FlaG [Desulfovibrionales bacterium]|nr:flagellar protein FlaG [Desulfovibrionales bacterium]